MRRVSDVQKSGSTRMRGQPESRDSQKETPELSMKTENASSDKNKDIEILVEF